MPVSDETPFAGGSPAITASQACRHLSQLCRLFASDLQLRLLRRNFSLVASCEVLEPDLAVTRQMIVSFCDGGLEPPNP